jgi:pyruvate formate lyase activating enzyme
MQNEGILIKGFLPMSTIDYKGKVASTIFLQGCNFRCPFCHNPELVPISAEGDVLKADDVISYLKENKDFVDAVCISGGEPTIHAGLPAFIARLKKAGFAVKLQTNGTNPEMLKKLVGEKLLDYISMDIKAPLEKYGLLAGVKPDMEKIKQSAKLIINSGTDYSFHTTVSPELDSSDIKKIGEWLNGAKLYYLQQFRQEKTLDPEYEKKLPRKPKELKEMADSVRGFFGKVVVEGADV